MPLSLRTIIQESAVSEALDAASGCFPRIDDVYRGLEWWLAHRPEDGFPRGDGFYVHKQDGIPSLKDPTLTVVYRYSDSVVNVIAIRIT